MDDQKPIDLSARRLKKRRNAQKQRFASWAPSYTALLWMVLLAAAVGGYVLFGKNGRFAKADLTGTLFHSGGIAECGVIRRTCLVDGDTGWQDGTKWRMLAIDAPEMDEKAECDAERERARASLARLTALMADGYALKGNGKTDKFDRVLVDVVLRDGRDAGTVLKSEKLAQQWPNEGNVWCGH